MTGVFDPPEKRSIAGRARTLVERIDDPEPFVRSEQSTPASGRIMEAWREMFPNETSFERRLEREGVTETECRRAIRADEQDSGEPIPEWIRHLEDLVEAVQSTTPDTGSETSQSDADDDQWVFGPLSASVTSHVLDGALEDVSADHLSATAIEGAFEWFRERFETLFWQVPFAEFRGNVAASDPELASGDPEDFEVLPTDHYERFVEFLFAGGFAELCLEYPMFARLLVTKTRGWERQFEEFCTRVRTDRRRLADRFDVDGELGEVVSLTPLASGPDVDRALLRVEFASGLSVVYKSRNVEPGATFYGVLDELGVHLPVPEFASPTFLARDGYGWMEWIEYRDCRDEAAVERYYRRAGALTCLAYFFELTDCSVENLVAAGEQPLLVDVETVLHPYVRPERNPLPTDVAESVDDSVLLTGLLPVDGVGEGAAAKLSGFAVSSDPAELDDLTEPVFEAVGTDVMTVERRNITFDRSENVPGVDGDDRPPGEFVDEIVDGFEGTYRAIMELRDQRRLWGNDGLLTEFETVEPRLVYRNLLRRTMESLLSVECLHDGARFGLTLERLAVPFYDGRVTESPPWDLLDAERSMLKRMEKPRFTCPAADTDVLVDGRPVGESVDTAGLQRCHKRIEVASCEDMREQIELIRDCFA